MGLEYVVARGFEEVGRGLYEYGGTDGIGAAVGLGYHARTYLPLVTVFHIIKLAELYSFYRFILATGYKIIVYTVCTVYPDSKSYETLVRVIHNLKYR